MSVIGKTNPYSKRILLVGGLGQTDLSGKVPRPGLLMLRQALERSGHGADIANYSTSLMERMFPPSKQRELASVYNSGIKPVIIEGSKNPYHLLKLVLGMKKISRVTEELREIEGQVFDAAAKELIDRVRQENFDAVGFSLYLGSSTAGSIRIAEILRGEFPDLPIIFGGPQTTHFAETIYRETKAPTALVLGEGEMSLVSLANILDELKEGRFLGLDNIPNLAYRDRTLDGKIIFTSRRRLLLEEWIKASSVPYEEKDFEGLMKYVFIETSRGCLYKCHFCPQPMLSGEARYLKPAKNVVDEMVEHNQRFGITHFEFVGSSTPPAQAEEIANEIAARGLRGKFSWVLFMRGKDERKEGTPLPDILEKMWVSGASAIFFGVEAADNATLQKMGKRSTIEDTKTAMLAAKAAGIATVGSFIYPYPGMPDNEGELILNFLKEVQPLSAPVQALGLYPGTYDAVHAAELGCEIVYTNEKDQGAYLSGMLPKPTIDSPEVLSYLLKYPLILSLPMKLWPPLPYKIDGKSYKEYVAMVNKLQRQIAKMGILLGFSHSHYLISQATGLSPKELSERMFYCALTGDPIETRRLMGLFNAGA